MPCYVTGSAAGDAQLQAEEAREEATLVTRLLCVAVQAMREQNAEIPLEIQEWAAKHDAIDRRQGARCEAR